MTRFLPPLLFMLASFLLLWWVQVAVDAMHRDAVEAIGRSVSAAPQPAITEADATAALAALRQQRSTPRDLVRVAADRAELLRRLRLLWITLTLAPVLLWIYRASPREHRAPPKRMNDGRDVDRPIA